MGKRTSRYIVSPQARRDAHVIAVFISEDNPEAADRFLRELERLYESLAHMPKIGSQRSYHHKSLLDMRMLPVPGFENYLIFYRPVREKGIEVIRVIYAARDIPTLFE